MQIRRERLESIILKNVSQTISYELTDKNIGFPTVTGVSLTNDYSFAKIYVTFLDNSDKNEMRIENLNKAKGLVRSKLAKALSIRKCPELEFVYDDSLARGNRIDDIIKSLNK